MEKKTLIVNCAVCDARDPQESVLEKYEGININSATILVTPESKELLASHNVNTNCAKQISVLKDAPVQVVNGKIEISADSVVEEGTVLIVNGKVTVVSGGESNLHKYAMIYVNGKMLCPMDSGIDTDKISVNGKLEIYPAGAIIVKNDAVIDRLFVLRAKAATYWSSRFIFVSDTIDPAAIAAKGASFYAKSAVVVESLAEGIVPLLNEDCDIVLVPDGTEFVSGELTLDNTAVMRYGAKLFVNGDLEIPAESAAALSRIEYLYVNGDVSVAESLQQTFWALKATCGEVKVVASSSAMKITDKISVKIDKFLLEAHPEGIEVSDCVSVKIAKDAPVELISERLTISDCANVSCSAEQESTVTLVCEDVANIGESCEKAGIFDMVGGILGDIKDKKIVNAAEYKL